MTLGEAERRKHQRHRPAQSEPTVSIVIPAKNEALNLPHVLSGLPAGRYEIIMVDGESTDDTVEVVQRLRPDVKSSGRPEKGRATRWPAALRWPAGTSSSCWMQTVRTIRQRFHGS